MTVKYTITTTMEHSLEEFEAGSNEECIEKIKLYIQDDPGFVIEGLDKFTIQVEEVK